MHVPRSAIFLSLAAAICTLVVTLVPGAVPWLTAPWGYALVNLCPGAALALLLRRKTTSIEMATSALLLSPVLSTFVAVLSMAAGASPASAGQVVAGLSAALLVLAILRRASIVTDLSGSERLALFATVAGLCLLTGIMPYTEEWWRTRSDAWFHRGVIAQIDAFGLPPEDPYFAGIELQYMWFYHVHQLTLFKVSMVRPQWTMAFTNTQALAGLILAAYSFASIFKQRFGYRLASAITVPLGMTTLFWMFLPLRVARGLIGETRGWDEVRRQLSLHPFSYQTVYEFMNVYNNPEFFLEKYIVATAFSLAVSLMVLTWASATRYIRQGERADAAIVFVAFVGMLGFHTLVGMLMIVTVMGGLLLLVLLRRSTDGFSGRRTLVLASAALAGLVLAAPYLYWITRLKTTSTGQLLVFAPERMAGVGIAVALVAVFSWMQREFWRSRDAASRFVLLAAIMGTCIALTVALPGANEYDKAGYFVFIPLALVGGWSLVDLGKRFGGARPLRMSVIIAVVCLAPVNVLGFLGWYCTPIPTEISADEYRVAEWVRDHTDRDDVFIDHDSRIFLLAEGPRRYYYGRHSYALQWLYDETIMADRHHAVGMIYATDRPIDANTLRSLGNFEEQLFIVVRPGADGADLTNVERNADLFEIVYRNDTLAVARVNAKACQAAAQRPGVPETPAEEIQWNGLL